MTPSMRTREGFYVLICLAAAVALTWPVARVFTTRIAGGAGDPHLTLWSMRWVHDAILSLQNPFFTPRLYHPQGTTLVFHTFDLPSALLVLPLWGLLPEIAIYNTAVLLAFGLTAYGMFRLAREVTADAPCALLAGILFAAVPYHLAHLGHLHLVSMGWVPLYLVHLLRIAVGPSRGRDAVLGGLFLGLASLASWYHLLFAAAITAPLIGYACLFHRDACFSGPAIRRMLILGCTAFLLVGPLSIAMLFARHREEILGAHDAQIFSADAFSFVYPNAIQTWCLAGGTSNTPWGTAIGEHATYVGYTVLLLALLGAYDRPLGRAFMVVAVVGALLSMGPYLQWGGRVLSVRMPYGYLEHLIPTLQFSGVPVRFGYVMYLGLITAAAAGLARLRKVAAVAPFGLALTVAAAGLALYEYRPCPPVTWESPAPALFRTWATDPRQWAVLDASNGWQQMWHATIHRKPIIGGYLGRVPKRLEDWMIHQPVIRAIMLPDGQLLVSRVDPQIDFAWSRRPDPELIGDRFEASWSGTLLAPTTGVYRFWLTTTARARLEIRQSPVADTLAAAAHGGGLHEAVGSIRLRAGAQPIALRIFTADRDTEMHWSWAPPDGDRVVVPTRMLRAADGRAGLDAEYLQHIPPVSDLGRTRGRAALRDLEIRYVITADRDNLCVQDELALPEIYRGSDVRVYAVPDTD